MLAGCSRPGQNKNAGSNNRTDPERGERPGTERLAQLTTWIFGVGDQPINGFAAKELAAAWSGNRFGSPARGRRWSQKSSRCYVGRAPSPAGAGTTAALAGAGARPTSDYLFACPRTSFLTLRFCDPRAYSRGFNGCSVLRFLRAVRFAFLRSSLLRVAVFAINAFWMICNLVIG